MIKKLLSFLIISLFIVSIFSVFSFSKSQIVGSGSIDSGLIGYWRFDNSPLDSSGNNNNGVLVNSPSYITGKYNTGLSFSTNKEVNMSNSASLQLSNTGTLACWVNFTNRESYPVIINKSNFGNSLNGYSLGFSFLNSRLSGVIGNGSAYNHIESSALSNNVLYFVVFTWNSTFLNFYVNGVISSTPIAQLFSAVSTANYFTVGGCEASYLSGMVDEVRVYNRALSSSEILTLYNGYSISVTNDLGSTVTPNNTVTVGCDQSQSFNIGALSGYTSWSLYIDSLVYASNPIVNFTGVQSNHTLYVTSQYIGFMPTSNPSTSIIVNNSNNINFNIVMFIILLIANIALCIKRVPILGLILGFLTMAITGLIFMSDTAIIPYFNYILIVIGFACMVINGLDFRRK